MKRLIIIPAIMLLLCSCAGTVPISEQIALPDVCREHGGRAYPPDPGARCVGCKDGTVMLDGVLIIKGKK